MKLIIQIPALNEEETIEAAIRDLPRQIPGISLVEVLLIDDGSTDATVERAIRSGADHVLSLGTNRGLARAFMAGLEEALRLGADVVVNTDADNQYCGEDVAALVAPIVAKKAQIVVGSRPISEIESFSLLKRNLQYFGSWVVRKASGTDIPDAPSGFRAYSREAAAQLYVTNTYSYTLETIIQAGRKRLRMVSVPVRVNRVERPSRLFRSMGHYVRRSMTTIIRVSILYAPLRFFFTLSLLAGLPGLVGIGRFLWLFAHGGGTGNIQSLVLSGALVGLSALFAVAGVIADLILANRFLMEDIRARDMLRDLPYEGSGMQPAKRVRHVVRPSA